MSKTRSEIEKKYGPTEEVASERFFVAIEDDDGDVWFGRDRTGKELVNAGGGIRAQTFREFVSVVHESDPDAFAEYVREETDFEEPDEPDLSPEDVAETWVRAVTSSGEQEVYVPITSDWETVPEGNHFGFRSEYPLLSEQFAGEFHGDSFSCSEVQNVPASDVPFSEVPDDD